MPTHLAPHRPVRNPFRELHDAALFAATYVWLALMADPLATTRSDRERGQATTEYALVLLAAASIALVLVAWATKGGKLTRLFDAVVDQLISKAK